MTNAGNPKGRMRCTLLYVGVAILLALLAPIARADQGTMPDVKHLALIIANADYDMDGKIKAEPEDPQTPGYLKDLANPCRDADLFRSTLLAANWKSNEIISPPCNRTADQMRADIANFRQKIVNSTNTVAIFYYSGHGAQFSSGDTSHSYLFGVGAKFDLTAVKASLQNSPGNTSFDAKGAVDLHELTSTLGRQSENGVLIILDACRNNPLYGQIEEFNDAPAITALSSNTENFDGIVVAYSTSKGEFAGDGFSGHSIYTGALSSLLKPTETLDHVLNAVRQVVETDYRKAYPSRASVQVPDAINRFSGDWCVWACPLSTPPLRTARLDEISSPTARASALPFLHTANVFGPALFRLASLSIQSDVPVASIPAVAVAPSPVTRRPPVVSVFDLEQRNPALAEKALNSMRFDIFWCDDDASGRDHERRALSLAKFLNGEATARVRNAEAGKLAHLDGFNGLIASVRVRRLSADGNTSEGFRYTQNLVAYDSTSVDEQQWAIWLANHGDPNFVKLPVNGNTPGYMSVAICEVASARPVNPTTIYLQVRSDGEIEPGAKLLNNLLSEVPHLTVPYPNDVIGGIESRVGPMGTDLRFYHPEDRNNTFAAAAVVERIFGHAVRVQYMPKLARPNNAAQMEIWIGETESAFPTSKTPASSSRQIG